MELSVDSIAQGGAGVARREGYVVFVEGGFPGDRVLAEVTKAKRDYGNARAVEVIEPSADRVPQRCDHEGDECPGSPWQALDYQRQLEYKHGLVAEALQRIGGLEGFELEPIMPAENPWRYRNKMEYSFGTADDGALALGFHVRRRWDLIRNARDCWLASERSNALRNGVREWCDGEGLSAYDRRESAGLLRNLVVREGTATGEMQVRIVTSPGEFRTDQLCAAIGRLEPEAGIAWTQAGDVGETTQRGTTTHLAGPKQLTDEVGGLRFRISPEAFFQTNTRMAERLYSIATDYAALDGRERVYDLYCGIGTLSLSLSLGAGEVWAVDVVEQAVADAIVNARLNEIENTHFFCGDVRDSVRPLAEQAPHPDVVVVDPPRAGLSKKVVRRLLETAPKRIVYVSCNPTTLAPNARQLVDAGYRLAKVRPVDMFPHTPHIECVAALERESAG
ncbi:MAG: 23S rRNA (uracil(1939)-C(5))-methyltransferase RlmD [Solirubrobacterales bacterium]